MSLDILYRALKDRPWLKHAACRGLETALWHPERGDSPDGTEKAKAICATCPVKKECLDWAVTHYERHGIWGGLNEKERRKLRQSRRVGRPVAS